MEIILKSLKSQILDWLDEDDLNRNLYYLKSLPDHPVKLHLNIKSDLVLAGSDYFRSVFSVLGADPDIFRFMQNWDGKIFKKGEVIEVPDVIPFNIAVTGERLALNLLQEASSIATWTKKHVDLANTKGISVLDTRKTTPGLRTLQKYAVRVGGGQNHRLGQTDTWMIKDNHKSCMGGLRGAYDFFKAQGSFYTNIVTEIHSLEELSEAIELGINHLMLDNFRLADIHKAIQMKKPGMTFEVSGGVKLDNLEDYLIKGVDVISLGSLIYSAPRVDMSLKFRPL